MSPRAGLAWVTAMLPLAAVLGGALAVPAAPGEARPVASRATPPAWVGAFPFDPERYVGIGRADKAAHPSDYREAAQAAALSQISRDISIHLKSEIRSTQGEDGFGRTESYSQAVLGTSENDLRGYELVDVYETEQEFWAYYALDKESFRETAEAEAARLDDEAAAVDAALRSRRLRDALELWASIRSRCLSAACGETGERVAAARRALRLRAGPWVFDYPAWATGRAASFEVQIEDGAGAPWKGPFVLRVGGDSVKTDAAGRFDPEELPPPGGGTLRVTCVLPGGPDLSACVRASVVKRNFVLRVRGADADVRARVTEALEAADVPCCRFAAASATAADPAAPAVEVTLAEPADYSLEGMHFTALRGSAAFPGGGPVEIAGKAGHSDPRQARLRAARDFARELARIPMQGG